MMYNAILNSKFIATKAGEITVYNYDSETREYAICSLFLHFHKRWFGRSG
ncbi:tail fiber assembly protein [Escherichia coli]|nr:tail fiber assembly protein [Escherichia coli]